MDTSERYIRMCEKAPELQPHDLEFVNGDCIYYKGKWGMYFEEKFYDEFVYNDESLIDYDLNPFRLHTQDQLQEMIIKDKEIPIDWHYRFHLFLRDNHIAFCSDTMEQLWMAFVMHTTYNKIWDNGEWCFVVETPQKIVPHEANMI